MADQTPCTPCFNDYISCGLTSIRVIGTLVPDAPYVWIIRTAQNAMYSGEVTTNSAGGFTIPVISLPPALLNPYAGIFTLTVRAADAYECNSSTWNDSAYCDGYDCISFEVRNGDHVKDTLGCPCMEIITGDYILEENGDEIEEEEDIGPGDFIEME